MTSSNGILLFAYNSTYDYVKIANACAALAKKYTIQTDGKRFWELPVTVVTDSFGALKINEMKPCYFDNVIVHDTEDTNKRTVRNTHDKSTEVIDWRNLTRADAFDLSPYDKTLMLDCDYFMFNLNLGELFRTDVEFTCYKDVHDVTGTGLFRNDARLSEYSVPMLWATVIYFTKSSFSRSVFDMMQLIKENYLYYSRVYGFKASPYRNDFALSIAYHAMCGYGLEDTLPFKMPMLSTTTDLIDIRENGDVIYQYKKNKEMFTGITCQQDLHIMNKAALTDEILEKIIQHAQII